MADQAQQQKKFERMTRTRVKPLILKLAVPTILSMLVSSFYNLADTFFVGMLNNDSITGAVGVVFSVMAIIQAVGFFFGHGSGNFVSRELGKQNVAEAEEMVSVGFFSALAAGVLIMAVGLPLLGPFATVLGATETVKPYAMQYMRYILMACPFMTSQLVLNNQLRFQGNAFYAMIGIVSGAVLNIGLDPLLIFYFDLGVEGAAIATAVSQCVSFVLLLVGVQRSDNLKVRFKTFRPRLRYYRQIVNGGTPSLCRQGLSSVASICLNHIAGGYGDLALAAFTVVQKIMGFGASALIGFGQGFQPVCGFNWGAGKYNRVKEAFWFCVKVAAVFLTGLAVVGYLFAEPLVVGFCETEETVALAAKALRAQLIVFPVLSWVIMSNMMLQNIGMVFKASILAMARQGLTFVPVVLLLPNLFGLEGLVWSQPVADLLALCIALPVQISVLKKVNKAIREGGTIPT